MGNHLAPGPVIRIKAGCKRHTAAVDVEHTGQCFVRIGADKLHIHRVPIGSGRNAFCLDTKTCGWHDCFVIRPLHHGLHALRLHQLFRAINHRKCFISRCHIAKLGDDHVDAFKNGHLSWIESTVGFESIGHSYNS